MDLKLQQVRGQTKLDQETIELYERRIDNCVRTASQNPEDSWAYNFWMQTAGTLLRKLIRNTNAKYN